MVLQGGAAPTGRQLLTVHRYAHAFSVPVPVVAQARHSYCVTLVTLAGAALGGPGFQPSSSRTPSVTDGPERSASQGA